MQEAKEADQEDEEEGLQSEEKPFRRFRLKRNVTLSSQVCLEKYYSSFRFFFSSLYFFLIC